MSEAAPNNQLARLIYVLGEQKAEIDRLRAENDKLTAVLEGNATTLDFLRRVIWDESQTVSTRLKAAAVLVPYEHAKPATTSIVVDFRERVRAARLKSAPMRTIEHEPEPPAA